MVGVLNSKGKEKRRKNGVYRAELESRCESILLRGQRYIYNHESSLQTSCEAMHESEESYLITVCPLHSCHCRRLSLAIPPQVRMLLSVSQVLTVICSLSITVDLVKVQEQGR